MSAETCLVSLRLSSDVMIKIRIFIHFCVKHLLKQTLAKADQTLIKVIKVSDAGWNHLCLCLHFIPDIYVQQSLDPILSEGLTKSARDEAHPFFQSSWRLFFFLGRGVGAGGSHLFVSSFQSQGISLVDHEEILFSHFWKCLYSITD